MYQLNFKHCSFTCFTHVIDLKHWSILKFFSVDIHCFTLTGVFEVKVIIRWSKVYLKSRSLYGGQMCIWSQCHYTGVKGVFEVKVIIRGSRSTCQFFVWTMIVTFFMVFTLSLIYYFSYYHVLHCSTSHCHETWKFIIICWLLRSWSHKGSRPHLFSVKLLHICLNFPCTTLYYSNNEAHRERSPFPCFLQMYTNMCF